MSKFLGMIFLLLGCLGLSLENVKEKKREIKERLKREYEFLSTLIQVREDKKLTMKLVETLIDKIVVYPDNTMNVHFRFSGGGTTE